MRKIVLFSVSLTLTQLSFAQNWVSIGGGADYPVRDFVVDTVNNILYAVGEFHNIGETPAYRVASWNGSSWTSLCGPPSILESNPIMWTVLYNNELYVSGTHYMMGDSLTGSMAHHVIDSTWETFGDPDGNAMLEVIDEKLFAYFLFDSIGGKPLKNFATWDGVSWEPFGDSSISNNINIYQLADIEKYNSNYVFGGNIDSPPYKELFQWDGSNWTTLGNGIPGSSAWVNCLKSYKGVLYIGGYFNSPGFPNFLVAWDGQNFFKPFPNVDFLGQVTDMEVINDELYILGPIEMDVPNVSYGLTKFDGDTLCVFGGSGIWGSMIETPGAMKIAVMNGDLYVTSNRVMLTDTVNYIAKWNGTEMDECIFSPVHLEIQNLVHSYDQISIYPNPAKDLLFIDQIGENHINKISVSNITGQTIDQIFSTSKLNKFDVSNYEKGYYFLSVESDSGIINYKWIKD